MKLKNIQIGDRIQAKSDIYGGTVEKGEIVEVTGVEPLSYSGELTMRIIKHDGVMLWLNHKDFQKAPNDGEIKWCY